MSIEEFSTSKEEEEVKEKEPVLEREKVDVKAEIKREKELLEDINKAVQKHDRNAKIKILESAGYEKEVTKEKIDKTIEEIVKEKEDNIRKLEKYGILDEDIDNLKTKVKDLNEKYSFETEQTQKALYYSQLEEAQKELDGLQEKRERITDKERKKYEELYEEEPREEDKEKEIKEEKKEEKKETKEEKKQEPIEEESISKDRAEDIRKEIEKLEQGLAIYEPLGLHKKPVIQDLRYLGDKARLEELRKELKNLSKEEKKKSKEKKEPAKEEEPAEKTEEAKPIEKERVVEEEIKEQEKPKKTVEAETAQEEVLIEGVSEKEKEIENLGFDVTRKQEERIFKERAIEEDRAAEKAIKEQEDEHREKFSDQGWLMFKKLYKIDATLKLIEEIARNGHITTYDIVRSFEEKVDEIRSKGFDFSVIENFDKRLEKLIKEAPFVAINNSLNKINTLMEIEPENNGQKIDKNKKLKGWHWQIKRILENEKKNMEKKDVEKYRKELKSIATEAGVKELRI